MDHFYVKHSALYYKWLKLVIVVIAIVSGFEMTKTKITAQHNAPQAIVAISEASYFPRGGRRSVSSDFSRVSGRQASGPLPPPAGPPPLALKPVLPHALDCQISNFGSPGCFTAPHMPQKACRKRYRIVGDFKLFQAIFNYLKLF